MLETPYLEKVAMKPFGPVDNGSQHLYGLDYRSDAREFTLRADKGAELYNIGENQYLAKHASTISYEATITIVRPA